MTSQIDAEKAAEEAQKRKEQERTRERTIENLRQRERADRGRGRGRGERAHHDYDRRPPRVSRSPPPRRRPSPYRDDYRGPPRRDFVDTYIPGGRGDRAGRHHQGRRRSPSPRRPMRRSLSRSVTPPRRLLGRGYEDARPRRRLSSPSRSPAPVRRGGDRDRRHRTSARLDDRARSYSHSDTSRSRSPRRPRRRRSSSAASRSLSPPARSRRRKHRDELMSSASISRSRSRSMGKDLRRNGRSRRSPSYTSDDMKDTRADARKGRSHREYRRRSRSRSRSRRSHVKSTQKPASRSASPRRQRDRKRHRSIERYAPAARRRRNTSSVSPPVSKQQKTADSSVEEANRHAPDSIGESPGSVPAAAGRTEEVGSDS